MSLAGISSLASTSGIIANEFNTVRKQDSNQLFSALENGDLKGAQAAYSQLAALNDKGSGGPYIGPKLSSDFAAIGQALQNGDLAGAQEAALQFGQDLLAANEKLRGGNGGTQQTTPSVVVNLSGLIDQVNPNNAAATPVAATSSTNSSAATSVSWGNATPSSTSTSGTTGATPEIVINLGGPNGPSLDLNLNGSEIEISLANGSGNNSASTIDLNFGGGATGSPIEISFGNNTSTNPSPGISVVA